MLLVVASRYDSIAHQLVDHWQSVGARLLTCADLSVAGWQSVLASPDTTQAVVSRQMLAARDIRGVLVRLPYVIEQEIPHIAPRERSYVAAEMNAFLTYWLSQLPCPVLNRPTATGLLGPSWRLQQWIYVAAQLGIPVHPIRQSSHKLTMEALHPDELTVNTTVTIVGNRCLGTTDLRLIQQARRLAQAAGVEFLAVHFRTDTSGMQFWGADLSPNIFSPELVDAILDYFSERQPPC